MSQFPKKLLVILAEAALEKALVQDVLRLGAHGYTVHDVRGGGAGGVREGAWEADRTIEMKVICDAQVADRLAQFVLDSYGADYGLSMYLADVSVLRPGKF